VPWSRKTLRNRFSGSSSSLVQKSNPPVAKQQITKVYTPQDPWYAG